MIFLILSPAVPLFRVPFLGGLGGLGGGGGGQKFVVSGVRTGVCQMAVGSADSELAVATAGFDPLPTALDYKYFTAGPPVR